MKKSQYSIGADVQLLDGEAGKVSRVVCDPKVRKPTYLAVKFSWPFPREVAVPVSLVTSATPRRVKLDLTREALEAFPDYEVVVHKGRYQKPFRVGHPRLEAVYSPAASRAAVAVRQRSVPESAIDVRRGMRVIDAQGAVLGTVDGLISEAEGQTCRHLVLRRKGGRLHLVPTDLFGGIQGRSVQLKVDADFAARLPEYKPERLSRVWFS